MKKASQNGLFCEAFLLSGQDSFNLSESNDSFELNCPGICQWRKRCFIFGSRMMRQKIKPRAQTGMEVLMAFMTKEAETREGALYLTADTATVPGLMFCSLKAVSRALKSATI